MLHLETVSTSDYSLRTRTQKVSNFLKYIDARFREHFIPGQNLLVDESIIRAFILYVESCKNISYNPMSHIKFRRELVMALVGDFCQGGGASTRGRTSTSDNQQRLKGMLHVIIPHPEKKHKDCIMCSKRNVPDGRKEITYICET
jgi:hypothetical protein